MKSVKRILAFLAANLIIAPSISGAYVGCPSRKSIDALGDLNAPLKVNQIDGADRRIAQDYAADHETTAEEIKRRYAASGNLSCGREQSSANVTLVGDVITTAAHSINGGGTKCVDLAKAPRCTFTVEVGGEKLSYETAAVIDSGWDCNSTDRAQTGNDWAVLKLVKKVDSRIKPYRIDRNFRLKMHIDTPVTAIGSSIDWPPDNKSKDLFEHPKHYGDCQTKQPIGSAIQTNCDLSPGSSGGALLSPGPDPILVGVHESNVYGVDGCPKPNHAKRTGAYSMCWANMSTLVTTNFADAIERAANESKSRP